MVQYWVSYWDEDTGNLAEGKGLVCAKEFSDALISLKHWYGDIETVHYLQWAGEVDCSLIENDELSNLNWDET